MEAEYQSLAHKLNNKVAESFLGWKGLFYTGTVIFANDSILGINQVAPEISRFGIVLMTILPSELIDLTLWNSTAGLYHNIHTGRTYADFNKLLNQGGVDGYTYYDGSAQPNEQSVSL